MSNDLIVIEIINWDKYQPRKDIKNSVWFRLDHNIVDDDKFYSLSFEVKWIFIHLLCHASKQNTNRPVISSTKHSTFLSITEKALFQAIQKLKDLQLVKVLTLRGRYADVPLHNKTIQTNKEKESSGEEVSTVPVEPVSHFLIDMWNSQNKLPKVRTVTQTRINACKKAFLHSPDKEYWIRLLRIVLASKFCCGINERRWVANFDWFIKPNTADKIDGGAYGMDPDDKASPIGRQTAILTDEELDRELNKQ